jgi:nucleotide-binding universal stress UspA family protein
MFGAHLTQSIGDLADAWHPTGTEAMGVDDEPILICYDGSEGARRAIAAAAALLNDRRAVVIDDGPVMVAQGYSALASDAPYVDDRGFEDALGRGNEGAELARKASLRAEARAGIETPTWRGIVEAADEIGAAAIVLGSRGLTGLREPLERSVSHQVAKHAGRPVLIVPPAQ